MSSRRNVAALGRERAPFRIGRGLLFVACQGFGDVVQSLPFLQALCVCSNGRWPVHVLLATPEHYELIRREIPHVRALFIRGIACSPLRILDLLRQLRDRVECIVAPPEISAGKVAVLKRATTARWSAGEAAGGKEWLLDFRVRENRCEPFLQAQDKIAAMLGLPVPLPPPALSVSRSEQEFAAEALQLAGFCGRTLIVGIQCGASNAAKCWPAANFAILVNRLAEIFPGIVFISFGDTREAWFASEVRLSARNVPWLDGTGRWTIRETAAVLNRCDLFISGDTGLMHIAAALGVKTLSIFGPTSPARRAPRHNAGIALAPCIPCGKCLRAQGTACNCIEEISAAQVAKAAERLLRMMRQEGTDPQRFFSPAVSR